ncbi:MAG: hypothetical protein COA74_11450 [Gammaproteobacteria bacterium]|nr:MAG: hypothetical protein COA74_11450 [Gammaproteobacteria bacterium]
MIMQLLRKFLILMLVVTLTACSSFLDQQDTPPSSEQLPLEAVQTPSKEVVNWSSKAIDLFNQANKYLQNDSEKAANLLNQAIIIEPKMEAAYFNLMRLYLDNSKSEEMQLVYIAADKEQVLSARMLNLMATEKRTKGLFREAETLYLSALSKNSTQLSVLANMAILQDLYLHNLPEAQKYYLQYQKQLTAEEKQDKRLANWLADIKRRIAKLNKESN